MVDFPARGQKAPAYWDTQLKQYIDEADAGKAALDGTGKLQETQVPVRLSDAALSAAYAPKWRPSTAYTAGQVVMAPDGGIVKALTAFTSGATYNPANWTTADGPAAVAATAAAGKADRGLPSWAVGHTGPYDPERNLYNWKASNTRMWFTKLARARAGLGYARLNCYGDSITQGSGAPAPLHTYSWPARLRNKFNALYGAAGSGACYVTQDSDDTRFVSSGTWTSYNPFGGYGVWAKYSNQVGAYYTFTETCDSFTVTVMGTVGAGPVGISIDGGAVTNYPNTRTPNGPLNIVVPAGSLGTHTIKIQVVTGAVWLESVEATIGSAGVRVTRWGKSSATARWAVKGQDDTGTEAQTNGPLAFSFDPFPPDLSIIAFGVNEYLQHISVAEHKTYMQAIITKAKTFGDVLLVTGAPNGATTGVPSQADYAAALYELADTNDVALFDLHARWQSYAASSVFYPADLTHPGYDGLWDIADGIYRIIGPAI